MNYLDHISINPNVRFGKPCIKSTRISVDDVIDWIDAGKSFYEIISDFPELNEEKIKICLAFEEDKNSKKDHTD